MSPARREILRALFDETRTPQHALGRKLIAKPVFEYDIDHPLRVDDCERCGAIHWRDCVCDPCAPRNAPTAEAVRHSRALRLVRGEV